MPERNPLVAAGDTVTIKLPRDKSVSVSYHVQSLGGAAGQSLVPEVSYDDEATYEVASSTLVATGAAVTAITALGTAWARLPGATHARLRLGALTSGGPIAVRVTSADGI